MRFERLDLAPYGRFADRSLRFSPDAALHVVFGANEAGKTTILEAIGDFLFDVRPRTRYAFAHGYGALRIGASVQFADGARLDARRRKAEKNTLVDETGKALPDERLRHALAGLDRESFEAEFGLTARRLREGGEALLKAGGKLAETLAAGSASLGALSAAQRRLADEANDLFTPERRSAGKPLYAAVERYKAATTALKAAVVDSNEWKAAEAALEKARLRELDLSDRRRALDSAVRRRQRAKRVAPRLAALAQAAERLAALGPAPPVSAATLDAARAALASEAAERAELERLAGEDAEAARALAGLVIDGGVLAAKAAVQTLGRRIGAAEDYETSLPRRIAEEEDARIELDEIARKLGLAGADELIARNPTNADLARVRALVAGLKRADDLRAKAQRDLTEAQAALAALDARRPEAVADPAGFKSRLESFDAALEAARNLARERAAIGREEKDIGERAAALDPAVASLEALARAALPDEATLARRAEAERLAEEAARAARLKLDEAAAAVSQRQATLDRLEAEGKGATRADWAAACARREAAFDRLAAALDGPAESRGERFETVRALALAADATAERLITGADRAARLQAARDELAKAETERRAREAAQAEAQAAREREAEATRALWAPSGVAAGPSARMAAWRRAAAELLDRRDKLETRRAGLDPLAASVEAALATLARWSAEAGAASDRDAGFEETHRAARIRLKELETAWLAARDIEIARTQAGETVARAERALGEADETAAALRRDWPAAMAALGLREAASAEEAEAALDAWASVGVPREKLRSAIDRIEKIRANLVAFAAEAAATLAAAGASDLAGQPALAAAARLTERLAASEKAAAERERLSGEAAKRAARRAGIDAARAARAESLARIHAALGASDGAEMEAALERAMARAEVTKTIADLHRDLADLGDGLDEAQLRAEQGEFDPATLDGEIAEAEEAQKRLWDEFKRANEEQAAAKAVIDALSTGRDAAGAARERAEAGREVADVAERWLVRAAASALARRAIERYRAAAQDPLIARAGEMFALATAGHFSGLGVGFDEHDAPVLAARRRSGETVEVNGLSEGARDQLFLALRLALLERRAGEPLPFIGDDLLASFDDSRTAQALGLLAEFGQRGQAILFTHHARVAELARGLNNRRVEVIEMDES